MGFKPLPIYLINCNNGVKIFLYLGCHPFSSSIASSSAKEIAYYVYCLTSGIEAKSGLQDAFL